MTKSDRQKLRLLIILLAILGVTVFIGYRMNRAPNPAVVQAKDQKAAPSAAAPNDARIQLELLDKARVDTDLGKSNLFVYRNGRPPEQTRTVPPPQHVPPPIVQSPPSAPTTPVPALPPPPPPIPLKYLGYAYVEPNSRVLIATLNDDSQQRHFNAVEGDTWMGRYRILRITDAAVEVEDMETSRRQNLPLIK